MILLNPGLLWFLPGALLPLLLHLLWRRRLRLIPWGAMGPLRHLRQQHLRQLVFERWTLLLLRMLMLAALLLALCRPVWQLASDPGWRGVDGRTAAVILIDDSPSSRRGRERQAWEVMQDLLASYLAGLQPGDEVSLLRASQLGIGAGEPRFDHERLQRHVAGLRPTDVRSDLPALFAAGLEQLEQHINPQAELVLVTDDAADGWARLEDPAWDPLWQALQSAAPPRVLHLRGRGHPAPGVHHAVAGLQVPSPLVLSGETVPVAVDLQHWGPLELPRNLLLRLSVDGIPRQERLVSVQAAGGQTVELPIRLDANGGHSIGVHLLDAADDDPSDDGAHVAVNVVERLPVLIVTGGSGSSRFLRAALEAAPPDATSVFTVEQLHFSQLDAQRLARVRVVVLQDVPVLPSEQVAALEQFVVGGGGVLVSCGPGTDVDLVNRFWARGGDGFLPTPVHPARDLPPGTVLQAVAPGHPVLNGLPGGARWQTADVHRALLPDPDRVGDAGLVVLVRLD
ncbi:MAG: BatA domain-containing protein, partial [Planctomycetota bacterium]